MKTTLHFFKSSFLFLAVGLILAFLIGAWDQSSAGGRTLGEMTSAVALRAGLEAGFIAFVLAALEISLSFDNAIVNASVLRKMSPLWQHRFLTWGMWIAVFLMRLIFPLAIVSLIARVNPWAALKLAIFDAARYAEIMHQAHVPVSVFGGTFLTLVASHFFFNEQREGIWIEWIERPLSRIGKFKFSYLVFTAVVVLIFSSQVSRELWPTYFLTAFGAMVAYLFIHGLSSLLAQPVTQDGALAEASTADHPTASASSAAALAESRRLHRASAMMFVYLEILDASFSFDGVVGAFAITNHLLIITIGLSIGALFVRSLTLMLVEKQSLADYIYLEAGAFHAIAVLGLMLFISLFYDVPETVTGLSGLIIIAAAWLSSHRHNGRQGADAQTSQIRT